MLAHTRQQRWNFASRLYRPAQQGRSQVASGHVPRALDVFFAVVRILAGDALAPAFQAIGVDGSQQNPAGVGASEAGLKEMDERNLQFAQCDSFNSHGVTNAAQGRPVALKGTASAGPKRPRLTRL